MLRNGGNNVARKHIACGIISRHAKTLIWIASNLNFIEREYKPECRQPFPISPMAPNRCRCHCHCHCRSHNFHWWMSCRRSPLLLLPPMWRARIDVFSTFHPFSCVFVCKSGLVYINFVRWMIDVFRCLWRLIGCVLRLNLLQEFT